MRESDLEELLSERRNRGTEAFIQHRLREFEHEKDGSVLLKNLRIPYLKMPVPQGPWDEMLLEAVQLEDRFVSHRSSDSEGWKSLCLHGISAEKTRSCDRYGFASELETPYQWTDVAEKCPRTTAWLRQLLEEKYFDHYYRVRYMWLEPGGYINFHRDREPGRNSLGPLNIALNMPEGCHWLFKDWGKVPFHAGSAICVDVSNEHSVINDSREGRLHIIIHGRYGKAYYQGLVRGAQIERARSALRSTSNIRPRFNPPVAAQAEPPSLVDVGIWNYIAGQPPLELRQKCEVLTSHFLKLTSQSILDFPVDHSLTRLLDRAARRNVQWAVIVTPGFIPKNNFFRELKKTLASQPPSVFLLGDHLEDPEVGYGLRPQFMAINVRAWRGIGSPAFSRQTETARELVVPEKLTQGFARNPSRIARTWTPHFFGWNILDLAWRNDFETRETPMELRRFYDCLYPENNSTAVREMLSALTEAKPPKLESLDDQQKNVVDYLRCEAEGFKDKVFLFNTEGYYEVSQQKEKRPLDGLFTVSSGFKDLFILKHHGYHKDTLTTYFDISQKTLLIKKYIFEQWNGRDFPAFMQKLINTKPDEFSGAIFAMDLMDMESLWQKEISMWGGADALAEAFLAVRDLPKRYIHLDILRDPQFFAREINSMPGTNFVVWHSNCFNYTPAVATGNWDMRAIEYQGLEFISSLHDASYNKRKHIVLYGEDVVFGSKCDRSSGLAANAFD